MNLDLRRLIPVLVALVTLGLIGAQTFAALRAHGPWRSRTVAAVAAADPYSRLERLIVQEDAPRLPSTLRDPFGYGAAAAVERPAGSERPKPRPQPAPEPEKPVLTAIVSDENPTAILRYEGRSYTVRGGDLFADFRVVTVTADRVVLDSGGRRIVLERPTKKGD